MESFKRRRDETGNYCINISRTIWKNETVLFGDDSTPPSSTSSAAATATGNQFTSRALSDPSDELCSDIRLSASHGKRNWAIPPLLFSYSFLERLLSSWNPQGDCCVSPPLSNASPSWRIPFFLLSSSFFFCSCLPQQASRCLLPSAALLCPSPSPISRLKKKKKRKKQRNSPLLRSLRGGLQYVLKNIVKYEFQCDLKTIHCLKKLKYF